jgi:RNA polymerase-interacting CarD/CdnL/TRCF family regulator
MDIDKQKFYLLRVDSGLRDIVKEGGFDDCMTMFEKLNKENETHIYIVREKQQADENLRTGELL